MLGKRTHLHVIPQQSAKTQQIQGYKHARKTKEGSLAPVIFFLI